MREALRRLHADVLKPQGLRRRGTFFVRVAGDLTYVIQVQMSRTRPANNPAFVLNFGIVAANAYEGPDQVQKSGPFDWQWFRRVCGDDGVERWFSPDIGGENLLSQLKDAVRDQIKPLFDSVGTEGELLELWRSGGGSGIPEGLELYYRAVLLGRAGRHDEFEQVVKRIEQLPRGSFRARLLRDRDWEVVS